MQLISQNHRTADVGRHLWQSLSPTPYSKQGQLHQVAQDLLSQVLNVSKDRDSTTSLDNWFQC